ncbi:hypothetical protein IJT93_05895 [bacterium]|nr:hypothetical protein [bacterium]
MSGDSRTELNKNGDDVKSGVSCGKPAEALTSAEAEVSEAAADADGKGEAADTVKASAELPAEAEPSEPPADADEEAGNEEKVKAENAAEAAGGAEKSGRTDVGGEPAANLPTESDAQTKKEKFWNKSNIAGLIFILALIGFNLIIYSGAFNSSGDSPENIPAANGEAGPPGPMNQGPPPLSDGLPHDDDGKPHPPAPPPPPGQNGKADTKWTDSYIKPKNGNNRGFLSGPSVLKCIIYLANTDNRSLTLTQDQRRRCREELKELIAERTEYNRLAAELASYFTPQQLDWYNKHRGDPEVPEDKKKGGAFNYLIDASLEILKDRAGRNKATDTVYKHSFIDTMLNDIVACIIKCEKEEDLKLTPGQAAAMLPIMPQLVKLEKKMDERVRFKLCMVFSDEQAEWLSKHMNEINIDNNMVMLLYADLTVSRDGNGEQAARPSEAAENSGGQPSREGTEKPAPAPAENKKR